MTDLKREEGREGESERGITAYSKIYN